MLAAQHGDGKGHGDLLSYVLSGNRPPTTLPPAHLSEEVFKSAATATATEELAQVDATGVESSGLAEGVSTSGHLLELRAKLVIQLSFLGIAEHIVGGLDLLKPLGRLFLFSVVFVGVQVRVVFPRLLPVGLLDFLAGCVFGNPQELVVIFFGHLTPIPIPSRPVAISTSRPVE